MKNIKLINPENAIHILNEKGLTTGSDQITVFNEGCDLLILNNKEFSQYTQGEYLKVGFGGGGIVGVRYGYITIPLNEYSVDIEIELIQLNYGIALKINDEVIYYRISYLTFDEVINFSKLKAIDLSGWLELESLEPLKKLKNIESIKLTIGSEEGNYENRFDFTSFAHFPILNCLSLDSNYSSKLDNLSTLKNLEILHLYIIDGWGDGDDYLENLISLSFIENLHQLRELEIYKLRRLSDVFFLNSLQKLEKLNLNSTYAFKKITLNNTLSKLKYLELSVPENLTNLEFLEKMPNLETIKIQGNKFINDISQIGLLKNLKILQLDSISNLKSVKSISQCENIQELSLQGLEMDALDCSFERLSHLFKINISCSDISTLSYFNQAKNLRELDISACNNLTRVGQLVNLEKLKYVDADYSENIRDIEKLALNKNLQELKWMDMVLCKQILMFCAYSRSDIDYIYNNITSWIENIEFSKNENTYITNLLNCISLINVIESKIYLYNSIPLMRLRGKESETKNDLQISILENWCHMVINLPLQEALECLDSAIADLDIVRETEVVMGPVIVAYSDLAELYPKEKENFLQKVKNILQLLDGHAEEERQIAPSAAVFYASLKMREEVLFWLDKATDEKAPQWRERVLLALIKHYSRNEKFSEAQRLLDEMIIQDEKDMAVAIIAEHMASKHPVDAGFLLDEIKDLRISSSTAKKMLSEPAIFVKPQSLYQLLLHLQETPDELAACLEAIISKDTTGKSADALRNLFVKKISSEPSALKFLELCEHKAISDFVKPRALEKFKKYLTEKSEIESTTAIPFFILALQEHELINMEEADELTQQMK